MPLPPPPELQTQRLLVRLVTQADLPALMLVNGDDAVTRFLPYRSWQTAADAQAWFDRMQAMHASGSGWQFVLVAHEGARVIGSCLLFRHDEGSARAELGYVLGRAHWGRGYMHEALQGLLRGAFGPLGLRRIEAEVNPANQASVAVLERLGFTLEGLLRQRWVGPAGPYDVRLYGLLRDEFQP
jgi:RimJ/RimL family protein N-acetyltransferase